MKFHTHVGEIDRGLSPGCLLTVSDLQFGGYRLEWPHISLEMCLLIRKNLFSHTRIEKDDISPLNRRKPRQSQIVKEATC